jgi:transposase-like protein
MKQSRFSEEQMVKILPEADKHPVAQVVKKHAVSEQTIYAWRKRLLASLLAGPPACSLRRLLLLCCLVDFERTYALGPVVRCASVSFTMVSHHELFCKNTIRRGNSDKDGSHVRI